jgi:hypothetical protein
MSRSRIWFGVLVIATLALSLALLTQVGVDEVRAQQEAKKSKEEVKPQAGRFQLWGDVGRVHAGGVMLLDSETGRLYRLEGKGNQQAVPYQWLLLAEGPK